MKSFLHKGVGRIVGAVKQPSEADLLLLKAKGWFHELFDVQRPTAPTSVDYITPALPALSTMLGNGPDPANPPACPNGVGDCVIAEDLHLAAMRACNAGAPWVPTTAQALAEYSAVTGFVATDPTTDQGTDPMALVTYRKAGNAYPDGSKLLDARLVEADNKPALQLAIWLAVGCFAWASLPDEWESQEDGGDVWDVAGAPNPNNGHGFGLASYDENFLYLAEWGEANPPVKMTYAAAAKYLVTSAGGGVLALLDDDMVNRVTGLCPAGMNLATLTTTLDGLDAEAA